MGRRIYEMPVKGGTFRFDHTDTFCQKCSFAFNSTPPDQSSLLKYYRITETPCRHNYSDKLRIDKIAHYIRPPTSVIDVGDDLLFQKSLKNSGYDTDEPAEVITAYYVLEHVIDPREFLLCLSERLKADGYLFIEVPHSGGEIQPVLFPEHLNMFNPYNLAMLAHQVGFELIEVVYPHSRPFGFLSVFKRVEKNFYKRYIESQNNLDPLNRLHLRKE